MIRLRAHVADRYRRALWESCLAGREPAESLSTMEREQLVMLLAGCGMSTLQIALHTRLTEYTTDRIRRRGEQVRAALRAAVTHAPLRRVS